MPFVSAFLFPEQAVNKVAAMRERAMDSFFIFISMWVSVCKCSDNFAYYAKKALYFVVCYKCFVVIIHHGAVVFGGIRYAVDEEIVL